MDELFLPLLKTTAPAILALAHLLPTTAVVSLCAPSFPCSPEARCHAARSAAVPDLPSLLRAAPRNRLAISFFLAGRIELRRSEPMPWTSSSPLTIGK
jgi:hypothetical protein